MSEGRQVRRRTAISGRREQAIGRQFPGLVGRIPSLLHGLPDSDRQVLRKVQRLREDRLERKMQVLANQHMNVLRMRFNEDVFEEYYNLHSSSDSMRGMESWVLDQFHKTLVGDDSRAVDILTVRQAIEAIRDNPKRPKKHNKTVRGTREYNGEELSHMAYHLAAVMSRDKRRIRKLYRESMGITDKPRVKKQ